MRRILSLLLVLVMLCSMMPMTAFAAEESEVTEATVVTLPTEEAEETEATEATEVPEVTEATEATEATDPPEVTEATETTEATAAPEATEATEAAEETQATEPVCTCGTDDAAIHATSCPLYAAPAEPMCFCVEKCAEANEWCDICGFDYAACAGTDTAITYEEETATIGGTSDDGLTWTYDEANGVLTISGNGPMANYNSSNTPWDDYLSKVTALVVKEGVTSVGNYAFYNGSKIASVTLPEGITSICERAFYNCGNITSLNLPDSIAYIGYLAFYNCEDLADIHFPSSLITIDEDAFKNCDSLVSVDLPEGLTSIGKQAFDNCDNLASVYLPDSLTFLGGSAFLNCSNLAQIAIPDGITSIENRLLDGCSGLSNVTLPGSLQTIGTQAFNGCTNLAAIDIPESVTVIGNSAFNDCASLTEIVIPDGVTVLGHGVLRGCTGITDIVLHGGIVEIGQYALKESGIGTIHYLGDASAWDQIKISTSSGTLADAEIHYCTYEAAVEPTCTEAGRKDAWVCSQCGVIRGSREEISALSHNYVGGACVNCGETAPGPIITQQPVDAEAALGQMYMVEVMAEGEGLTYQWYFRNKGSDIWYKSSVKDSTYDDVMTTARAGREVYCVITDANGNTVTTETAKLIRVLAEELAIVTQPVNAEARLGDNYCVTVEAKGEGLKYRWYFRNPGAEKFSTSSVTDNTYDDVMTTARADREVYCVITDALGNKVTTDTVKLVCVHRELKIVQQPEKGTAELGEEYCSEVIAEGDGLKYQWYFRNKNTDKWYRSIVKDNTYNDIMTSVRHGREIYCVITDQWGNTVTTEHAFLEGMVSEPLAIIRQPADAYAAMGENYRVAVEATGDSLKYQWYFRNAGTAQWYPSSVKDCDYDDVMTKARAGREVYCVITDAWGNTVTSEKAMLTRVPKEELKIITQPTDCAAAMGDPYSVEVTAQGEDLTYQWYFRNAGSKTFVKSSVRDNTYDDIMTKARAGREVYCVITDALGNTATTKTATLLLSK